MKYMEFLQNKKVSKGLTSIVIPGFVKTIGNDAFIANTLLIIEIEKGGSFPGMSELGAYIFDGGYLDWECTVLFTEFDNVTESVMVYGRARHSTDELTYELNDTGDGYIVIDKGATKGAIVIPEVYQGLPVVGIGDYAFAEDLIDVLSSRYVTSVRHTNLQYDFEGYSV